LIPYVWFATKYVLPFSQSKILVWTNFGSRLGQQNEQKWPKKLNQMEAKIGQSRQI
jgi:hypothetical protein